MLPENENLIRETERLLSIIKKNHDGFKELLPSNDIRLSFFSLTGNVLHSLLLHFASVIFTIAEPLWWQNHYQRQPNNQDIAAIDNLSRFSKHAFFVFFFSRIETLMRKTINLVSADFDPTGVKSFKNIYDEYLKKLSLKADIELFDIARLIRNSLHNNGTYISNRGTNRTLSWDGKEYTFRHKEPINFISTEEFFYLIEQLIGSIIRITGSDFFNRQEFVDNKYY